MFRQLRPYQLVVDISIAAVCFLLRVAIGIDSPFLYAVVFFMALALAMRRLSPGITLGVLWVGVAIQLGSGQQPDISNASVVAVLYVTSRYGTRLVRWLGLASAVVGAFLAVTYVLLVPGFLQPATGFTYPTSHTFVLFVIGSASSLALFSISWTLGLLVRTWATARESRAAQQAAVANQQLAERDVAIEQERTRIARDMHDVVAHSLAVVIAQADGARYAKASDPDAVDEALTTISTTAREALGDVRILLGQLRHSQGEGPQPVLADLDRLLDQLRASGLLIRYEESGEPQQLGTGQQLAAYRIVQESLTNALRHGDAAHEVLVQFVWTAASLDLDVTSGLREALDTGALETRRGHGLDGMRERAVLAGGILRAGPHEERFVVSASLPLQGAEVPA